ncbi:hypothetical protein BBJ66_29250 [Rhizobium sp. RSm-3]|nr:hypothetical protein BBJ66_29250 [Rhizobium sp. RSm-3]OWV69390.1 hypothetical protein ATY75_31425 [Rhizobium sp. N122]
MFRIRACGWSERRNAICNIPRRHVIDILTNTRQQTWIFGALVPLADKFGPQLDGMVLLAHS